jgi:DNA-binding PadR family transcriptional regulator
MYASLQKAKKLSLISTKSDRFTYPPCNMISLTDNGRKVAEKLKEIEKVLEE